MNLNCNSCTEKSQLIDKYVKLIKLLKTKCQKSTKSSIKSINLSSQSLQGKQKSNIISNISNVEPDQFQSFKESTKLCSIKQINEPFKLAILLIANKSKKALLKQSFEKLKTAAKIPQLIKSVQSQNKVQFSSEQSSISNFINQTLSLGSKMKTYNSSSDLSLKQLYIKNFQLQNMNFKLNEKVKNLQKQIEESQKRFMKQTQKKRQSLEAVAEQIRQKVDQIVELQHLIKQYQKISGKNFQRLSLQNVLIEDELQLKRACLRLENINQKLNLDVRNAQNKIRQLNQLIAQLKKQNTNLNNQNKDLKENNFDLNSQIHKINQLKLTYSNLCQKLNKKLQNLRLNERKGVQSLKLSSKGSEICSSGDIFSSKNTDASDSSPLSRKSSLKQLESQQKIQQIFSFLFNINDQSYKLHNEEVFDEDELKLLKLHKNSYLNNIHNQNPQIQPQTQKIMKNINLNQTDQIYYLKAPQLNIENSFFNALQPKQLIKPTANDNIKLIDLEIQKSKLIQKISDLKKMHMHIRDVFLNFLKTIDFTNLKTQSASILEIIFEVFQYSQDQKACLFKQKKKKFWGIL